MVEFFGRELAARLAAEGRQADLLVANNVMAHVPDLNDFVGGMEPVLAPGGVVTIEVPHLVRLVEGNQFDTIYHEHFSYFSFLTATKVLAAHGLEVFDVDELRSHGGSLRLYAQRRGRAAAPGRPARRRARRARASARLRHARGPQRVLAAGDGDEVAAARVPDRGAARGQAVAGYGAPGKGNTLLNYCGIRTDLLEFTVDRNPYKQGQFLPGTHIPIRHPDALEQARPDYILILPWNLKDEIVGAARRHPRWGARCVVPIPEVEVL